MKLDVVKVADNSRHAYSNDIRLVNLGPVALFGNSRLTTSSGKHLEHFSFEHIVSLMYKQITSARGTDDLHIGFDLDLIGRQRELTNNRKVIGKYYVRLLLSDAFGFA